MIRVQDLCFSYGSHSAALQDIQLDIQPGERLAIIGPNGSGKTTLARCLNGLLQPQKGRVLVDNCSTGDPTALFSIRQRVGMVFQNPDDQFVSTSVESEIAFGLENIGLSTAEMHRRVDEMLRVFHLESYRRHPPHLLSGGEKQRLAIAATVALRPSYLVLDEPTSLLDPQSRLQVDQFLEELQSQVSLATIYITQDLNAVAGASRIVVLNRGSVFCDGPPEEVFSDGARLQAIGLNLPFTSSLAVQLHQQRQWNIPLQCSIAQLADHLTPLLTRKALPQSYPPLHQAHSHKLSAAHLHYTYDPDLPHQQLGLDDVSVDIVAGGITALLGPSGSGKTTLAQHFNGLLKPQRGHVILDGRDIWTQSLPQIRRRVGLVFQFPELQLFEDTVAADVAYGPSNLGLAPTEIEDLSRRALEAVELPWATFHQRPPLLLSGGEKRRVALAGVLAMNPEVLILDEPTAGLDPQASAAMGAIFRRLQQRGTTIVFISHDMDLVAELATHVIVMQNGGILQQGEARALLTAPNFSINGLTAPLTVQLMRALHERDCPVPTDLLRHEEVLTFLTKA